MKILRSVILGVGILLAATSANAQTLRAVIDISEQTMRVYDGDQVIHKWAVSTARKGKKTPRGNFTPQWLSKNHKSSLYNNAPMPYSIFFSGNYAIHGTTETSKLGGPASAGCVRLSKENARTLFDHVAENGKGSLKIRIKD